LNDLSAKIQPTDAILTNYYEENKNSFTQPKASSIQPFDAVKDKVKEAYTRQRAEEQFAELRDQLADLTYEHPETLEYASKKLNLPIKTSELFSKDKPGKDISQYKKVRYAAFSNDVMNVRNNSDVIPLDSQNVVVIHEKSHIPSSLLSLATVSKQIETQLKKQEAEKRAEKFAEDLKAKLQAGSDPQQLANSYHLMWNKPGYMGRYSTKVDPAILDRAFRLPHPPAEKALYGITRVPNGYAIIALKSVKDGTIADKKQHAIFEEQAQTSQGLLEYELYKKSQINHAKIKIVE
jgi:peptidyl-prolyl cis-trans isomerase D